MHTGFRQLQLAAEQFPYGATLCFDDRHYHVNSNSKNLIDALKDYFSGYESTAASSDVNVWFYNDAQYENQLPFQNWQGEVGKTRLKEQYLDVDDGRWIHKFKTGMVMFQHHTDPVAIGPCTLHLSQMVNFIINQHINHLQQNGGLICHAACMQVGETGIAIAAHSGGGKSTTMLKLMDLPNSRFVSNDRLFLFSDAEDVIARGVPKQPRVNPGTLLNNPKLTDILPFNRQSVLQKLTTDELWQQEEKYDVMVTDVYGFNRIKHTVALHHVLLLNWQPGITEPVTLHKISLDERPELIKAIAKSPGSFYQDTSGEFLSYAKIPENSRYQEALRTVSVWEVTGGADFEELRDLVQNNIIKRD